MTEFSSEWIAQTREQLKLVSPLPWKACSCGKCGQISNEKDCIAIATRGNWGDDYPIIKPVGGSIGGQYEVVMEQITYGHVPPETGNNNAQYIAEACSNYPEALDEIERLQKRIAELEQERQWIPVKEWPNIQGWYRVITGDGLEKTRFWGLDHENNRCFWHVESSNEWIMMWTKPTLPQPPKDGE